MEKDILKQIIFEQQQTTSQNTIERFIDEELISCSEILIISGIRRCGKSTLLQQIRNARQEKDFYINFDDERLIHFTVDDFQKLHEVLIEIFGEQTTFYFDEIQNIAGWERFVRRLYDSGNKVFITGSNAHLLSKELGTHLTGRYIQIELYPFSFKEFLQYTQVHITEKDLYTTAGKARITTAFMEYIQRGGFPQYIQNKQDDYIKTVYQNIVYRDIMVRNNITNERQIIELTHYLASTVSTLSSFNSLRKIIGVKNAGTVASYIQYISDTYLLFQIQKFDYSLKKQIQNPKKTYFIDTAIVQKISFSFSENVGRLLENIVFIELKRRNKQVFYHSQKYECDFVILEGTVITEAIQVSYSIEDEQTKQREIRGVRDAMESYSLTHGTILTMHTEGSIHEAWGSVEIVPVWKWLVVFSQSRKVAKKL
jgi:predicted AAA+ superfamily ATPase